MVRCGSVLAGFMFYWALPATADTVLQCGTNDGSPKGKDTGNGTYGVNGNQGGKWSMRAGKPGSGLLGQDYLIE